MADRAAGQDVLVGQTLGHYRIGERIGSGGMGDVYRAHDEHLGRDVAVKVLPPGMLSDESSRKRFHKEATALSRLNHPNIATIHDFDTQQGVDFLVMEYIPGVTLSERLATRPLPEKEINALGAQLVEGLSAAHERGVVHRDLKPGNLRVTSDGRLKILDFGLAKLRLPVTESTATESLTETQTIAGTLPYMAPEQLLGGEIDARTDIHAAGAVLYEMATGRQPFAGVERSQLIGAILRQAPQPPTALNPRVSQEMERIIGKCLEKEPENRYQSAKELAVDLRRMTISGSTAQMPSARRVGKARAWKTVTGVLILGALLIVGGLFFRSRRVYALSASDTILLADFVNKTGDPVFDDALKQALAVELGQSPFLNIVSDRKVGENLRMMGRPANQPITMDVGRELCLRTGSKAVLDGAISSLGSHYLIALGAVTCSTGDTLAKVEGEATSKEEVLKVLSRASSSLRTKLGESLPSVQKFAVPVQATTSSLEALKNFSMAVSIQTEKGDAPSIPSFKRAIELDPTFPMAYAALAGAYANLGEASLAVQYATKAYELRERATERERLSISANYFRATGQTDKETQSYEMWAAAYPHDPTVLVNLSANYAYLGQWDKALAESQKMLRLAPDISITYAILAVEYLSLNRLDEAKASLDQAATHKLDSSLLHSSMYALAFLRADAVQMEKQLAWAAGKPGVEDQFLSTQSDTDAFYGRIRKAHDFSRRAVESALRADSKETAAFWRVNAALRDAELDNPASARQGVAAALALSPGRDVKLAAALTLARTGDIPRAKALVEELEKSFPSDTLLKFYWLPTINAAVELRRGKPTEALAYLEAPAPYELGQAGSFISYLYPAYVRGQAYLLAHNGTAAAGEFQKFLDQRGIVLNFVTGSLAHLQIGRAYAMAGETAKAKAAYQDFFTLWKDADLDLSVLKQAKTEYAKLEE